MPAPESPFEAVLHAARDVAKLSCALDAEMLGTALLGSVYAVAGGEGADRAVAVREFVGGFLAATDGGDAPIRQVFAALVPEAEGAARVRTAPHAPPWAAHLNRVHLTGCYAYGDVFGDQTSYLSTFAYEDAEGGGPEHAIVALVDHNIGIVKDVFVGTSAGRIVGRVRAMCDDDELTWFREEDPGRLRGEVWRHLEITDGLGTLPDEGSLATDRALAAARLGLLPLATTPPPPEPPAAAGSEVVRDFLGSPEAAAQGLDGVHKEEEVASLNFCLGLVLDHAAGLPGADPLRWSPAVAGLFLLDWVHRRAVLDMDDAAMLPRVVRAWSAYTVRRRDLPAAAAEQAAATIEDLVPEFARLYATGERRSPATAAVAQLISEGVDPDDAEAIDAWIEANRHRLDE